MGHEMDASKDPDDAYAQMSTEDLITENRALQKKTKLFSRVALGFGVVALIALGLALGLAINADIADGTYDDLLRMCGTVPEGEPIVRNIIGEPENPGVFHDLTATEIRRVRKFLEDEEGLYLVKPEVAELNDTHIYIMDLQLPPKADVLQYLDKTGNVTEPPERYAKVFLFRGNNTPPIVEERVCGPLHNISLITCNVINEMPFAKRPFENREHSMLARHLIKEIQKLFGTILMEIYGGSFDLDKCDGNCLNWMLFPVASNRYGNDDKRRAWILPTYDVSYHSLFPLDFGLLCDLDGVDPADYSVEKVWYSGILYSSPQELLDAYNNGTANKTKFSYPTKEQAQYATFERRGPPKPSKPRRPPELIEPDGKRYTVRHRKVQYLDMWSFHYRMSAVRGPALYDIRFLGERIVYELSLQELAVFYSGHSPMLRQSFLVGSSFLTGSRSKALVAGIDCPMTAMFLPYTVTSQGKEEPAVFHRSICIFEQNLGTPLRRHHSYSIDEGAFFGGMMDSALVVRSIHAVDNYDYIIDFTFHQNGAIGVSVGLTGFLVTGFYSEQEKPYGVKITERIFGSVHLHSLQFKVDLDVSGTSNRYETLQIKEETVSLREATESEYSQTRFTYNLTETEKQAAYEYEFDKPMYHIFHNNEVKNEYGERKSFRIVNHGVSKQLLRKNVGDEGTQPWTRYQLAVTKQKDSEHASTSVYSQWGLDKKANFQNYIDDDESIVDEDLVAWVTLGAHNIPHTEDLPVTSTSGKHNTFYLFPYNYFTECPSVMSRDALVINHKDQEKGLHFDFHGTGNFSEDSYDGACEYKPYNVTAYWARRPDALFETSEDK